MKRLILFAGVAMLAACGAKDDATAPAVAGSNATDNMAAPAPVAATVAAPGVYDVTEPDGTKHTTELKADGAYEDRDGDKVTEKGTWATKDGKTCFVPEGKAEQCYTDSARAADGSFTATGPDGKAAQVRPHAG